MIDERTDQIGSLARRFNRVMDGRYEASMLRYELSIAEANVMRLTKRGLDAAAIAAELNLTTEHVRTLTRQACKRIGVETSTQAILRLYELI